MVFGLAALKKNPSSRNFKECHTKLLKSERGQGKSLVWVIWTLGFGICFGFRALDFEF